MVMHNSRGNLLDFSRARIAATVRKRDASTRESEPIVIDDAQAARMAIKRRKRGRK